MSMYKIGFRRNGRKAPGAHYVYTGDLATAKTYFEALMGSPAVDVASIYDMDKIRWVAQAARADPDAPGGPTGIYGGLPWTVTWSE